MIETNIMGIGQSFEMIQNDIVFIHRGCYNEVGRRGKQKIEKIKLITSIYYCEEEDSSPFCPTKIY